MLDISENLNIATLLVIRPVDRATPIIGDSFLFANAKNVIISETNIKLFGAPFKNGAYRIEQGKLYLDVQSSFGGVDAFGYKCTDLSERRVLESNHYANHEKVILTLTIPIRDSIFGFGIDMNGTLSDSWSVMFSLNSTFGHVTMRNHFNISNISPFAVVDSKRSMSIFNIGPEYHTISMLISADTLVDQQKIYLAEFSTSNLSSHQVRTISHSILKDPVVFCTNFVKSFRIESESPISSSIILVLYALLLIPLIVLSKRSPLNTRGISPILTVCILFIQLLLEIRNYFEIPEFQGSLCVFFAYGIYPLQQIIFIMVAVYSFRYFSIINLNHNKNTVVSFIMEGKTVSRYQMFTSQVLKILTARLFTIAMLVFSYAFMVILFTIPLASSGFYCSFGTLITLKLMNNICLIIVYGITVGIFVIDVIYHFSDVIRCKWIDYIFYQDPYWFRAQIALYIPFMVYFTVVEFVDLATTGNYYGVVKMHRTITITNTITAFMLLCVIVLFSLIITIINVIVQRAKPHVQIDHVRKIMFDAHLSKLFLKHCESEFSVENYFCFFEIQEIAKGKRMQQKSLRDS